MPERLYDRISTWPSMPAVPAGPPAGRPDPAYAALPRLERLRDALRRAGNPLRRIWKEAPLFFFSDRRQALASDLVSGPYAEASALIATELPELCSFVQVRRAARGVEGLRAAAEAIAPRCPAAKDLADLLAIPDDEVFLVLHPELRAGFRVSVRGIVDIGQFHVLLADAIAAAPDSDLFELPQLPARFVHACRNSGFPVPAGIPMDITPRFQFYTHSAVQLDGSLPRGAAGCGHWLWPETPLSLVPKVENERVVLLGPPVSRGRWEAVARFPGMIAEVRVVETLGVFRTAERLSRLTGTPILPTAIREPVREMAKAA